MELKFVPRGTDLVPMVGEKTPHGHAPKRICARVKSNRWVMSPQPHVVDSASREGVNMIRLCKKGAIAPFDMQTATHCGVDFEPLEFGGIDVGWVTTNPRKTNPAIPARKRQAEKMEAD